MKCSKKIASLDTSWKSLPVNEVIIEVGKTFLGTPYVAGTLDENPSEELVVVCVTGLDCVTFVENCLVMSLIIKEGKADFDNYKKTLEKIRYRNGVNSGYTSRLHYFSDWIYDNQEKGIVTDITKEIGGVPYNKTIDFMTNHTGSYKQLSGNEENISGMLDVEKNINMRQLYFIPKENISDVYGRLQSGDIIGITSNLDGLDVAHTGYVYKDESGTYLLNASLKNKQVEISSVELQDYVMSNPKQGGIIVARVNEIK
ncbi:MAG: DUF1460 domain-containing protein [Ignavibacteria bacterium]|nr:DUF1460 domain-containing protein [Ignavibacteria bacterium]